VLAVRGYLRFGLSYRDVEELLAEQGVEVDHVTVYRWVVGSPRYWARRPGPAGTQSEIAGR
jgi:transposase-like protein